MQEGIRVNMVQPSSVVAKSRERIKEIQARRSQLTRIYNEACNTSSLTRPWESDDVHQMAHEYNALTHELSQLTGEPCRVPDWVSRWYR